MAISTFTELKTALENWSERNDLTNRLNEFIVLTEARINRDLRVRDMVTTTDLTVNAETVAQPSDMIEAIRLYLDTSPKTVLDYVSLDTLYSSTASATTGTPNMFSSEGRNFVFAPIPGSSITGKLAYYAEVSALSDSNTTNDILTKAPDIYLYGGLFEIAVWSEDDEGMQQYGPLYQNSIEKYQESDDMATFSGSPLRARVAFNP